MIMPLPFAALTRFALGNAAFSVAPGLLGAAVSSARRGPVREAPYHSWEHVDGGSLPDTSPDGYRWLVWWGTRGRGAAGFGIDANGGHWELAEAGGVSLDRPLNDYDREAGYAQSLIPDALDGPEGAMWPYVGAVRVWRSGWRFSDGSKSFAEQVIEIGTALAPVVAGAAATLVGGPVAGAVVGAVVAAAVKVSRGAPLTSSVVEAAVSASPSLLGSATFSKVIDTAKRYGLDEALKLRDKIVTSTEWEAFQRAQVMARGMVAQARTVEDLKSRFPESAPLIGEVFDTYAAHPLDIAAAFGGPELQRDADRKLVEYALGTGEALSAEERSSLGLMSDAAPGGFTLSSSSEGGGGGGGLVVLGLGLLLVKGLGGRKGRRR